MNSSRRICRRPPPGGLVTPGSPPPPDVDASPPTPDHPTSLDRGIHKPVGCAGLSEPAAGLGGDGIPAFVSRIGYGTREWL